jgi:hypothetical protein
MTWLFVVFYVVPALVSFFGFIWLDSEAGITVRDLVSCVLISGIPFLNVLSLCYVLKELDFGNVVIIKRRK